MLLYCVGLGSNRKTAYYFSLKPQRVEAGEWLSANSACWSHKGIELGSHHLHLVAHNYQQLQL